MNQDTRTEFWFLCHACTLVLYHHHHHHHNHICETTRHAHTYNTDERVNPRAGAPSSQNTSVDKRTARFFHTCCESEHVPDYTIRTSVSDATDSPLSQVTCYTSLDTLYLLNLTISTHYIQMCLVDDKKSYTSCYKVRKVGGCEPA